MGNGIHYEEPKKWVQSNLVGNLIRWLLLFLIFALSLLVSFFLPR